MARSVTLQSISDRARVHADLKSSSFINDTEMLAILNECTAELYDELVGAYENYYMDTDTITLSSNVTFYNLPADFYKILGIDYQTGSGAYVTLRPFMEAERNLSLSTNTNIPAGTLRIRYVPAPPVYTALTQSVDGVAGWDRLLSLLVAIDILDAEESDSSALYKKYTRTLDRIRGMSAPRDAGYPARITDVYKPDISTAYGSLQYRLQGSQIEVMNTDYLGSAAYPVF